MNKILRGLGFSMMLLFLLMILTSSVSAFADEQDDKEKEAPEAQNFWGSVGGFFEDGYNSASEGIGSIFNGQQSAEEEAPSETTGATAMPTELATTPSPTVESTPAPTLPPNILKHYLGEVVNTGMDNGYSGTNKIDANDPHFGWTLGRFFVSGYTRVSEDADGNPVFIKTLGDKVTLWFVLEQDINKLNGNDKLAISGDQNGYDEYFGVEKTDFGHGTLIIRHTDYQNLTHEPTVYTDYLVAKASTNADTQVELFEEGDYEVALDYEVKNTWQKVLGQNVIDSYPNYRIFFRFSVRNGNCMVYPFDVATKAELTNSSMTENGFSLDLAKSRYLDINIKKEVLAEGANGLTEDTRFNRPARDGDQYTEEGIYTIDVSNRYTGQQTTKKIYVGTNKVLKAFVTTGLSIKEIDEQLASGAQITDDGAIVPLSSGPITPLMTDEDMQASSAEAMAVYSDSEKEGPTSDSRVWLWLIAGALTLLCITLIVVIRTRSSSGNKNGVTPGTDALKEENK